jgi:lipoprotein-releasing system ATP-binding protein
LTDPTGTLIEARALTSSRSLDREGPSRVNGIDLSIESHTLTLIRGPEGCGKNLLLRLLGLLETPDRGEVFFRGKPTSTLPEHARADLCNRQFGFVFTTPFLLPAFTVMENIAMPLFKVSEVEPAEARSRIEELLRFVGLEGLDQEPVSGLSILDQYRVSLARALANRPSAIFLENMDDGLKGADLGRFAALVEHAVLTLGVTALGTATGRPETTLPDREIELEDGRVLRDSLATGKSGGATS